MVIVNVFVNNIERVWASLVSRAGLLRDTVLCVSPLFLKHRIQVRTTNVKLGHYLCTVLDTYRFIEEPLTNTRVPITTRSKV
jgi:hypothetical protein